MRTIFDHIERVKGQPHHIRKQVAFGAAGGATALIALVWFVHAISTGAWAIKDTSFADISGQDNIVTTGADNGNQDLSGATAAAAAAFTNTSAPAHIEIVDTSSSTQKVQQPEQTTLPF